MQTEQDVLVHAAKPGACSFNGAPDAAFKAQDAGLIVMQDAGYSQETVIWWSLTPKGRRRLER
jgi:hypothetical protein